MSPSSPASSSSYKRADSGKPQAPSEAGTASSTSQRQSMQQLLRQILVRPSSSRGAEHLASGLFRRAQAPGGPEPGGPAPRLELPRPKPALRIHTAPAALPSTSWPQAAQDEAQHDGLIALMQAFDHTVRIGGPHRDREARRMAALRGVIDYQQYLRSRMVDVAAALQDFKEQHQEMLAASPTLQRTLAMFRDINGPSVLSHSSAQSPFDAPEVMRFLAEQETREEALEDTIKRRVASIRRTHDGPLTFEKCRQRLIEEALGELVEKDLIQYYLEMTLLTRCQLTAFHERARLTEVVPVQPARLSR